jgi:hypothetical protein
MELGHHYLQLFMSMALILTAAVVAFICDMLKRNNEQLREMNIELKVRQEEEHRRAQVPAPRLAEKPERAPKPEKIAAPQPVAHVAAPHVAAPKERSAATKERKRTVNSEALAAMERGAALAGTGGRSRSAVSPEAKPEPKLERKAVAIVEPMPAPTTIKPPGIKKDWGSMLARNAQGHKPARLGELPLPAGFQAGFHDGHVLSKLVESRQPVSGLVVSIGVNSSRNSARKLPEGVSKLVESLLGPNDFAAQSGEDEFLLIYPEERGASAQRRLSQIAQQLWDFQLRSLGSFQILFSWGGVEVSSESIEEAIASASERMQETKRGRKLVTMEVPAAVVEAEKLREAV